VNAFQAIIQTIPEVSRWPELSQFFDHMGRNKNPDWELPLKVCTALGGNPEAVIPGAAALACLQLSIILVDDMLDNDPRGVHTRLGHGLTANFAFAMQSAAFRLVDNTPTGDAQRSALTRSLAQMALETARGQHLDVQNLSGEENYWRVVEAKSTPFYGACYQIGAILGGGDEELIERFYQLGKLTGEIIQLDDDLTDAFQKPANADWYEGRNNLLVLYASTADHPQRDAFLALLPQIGDAAALEDAQKILISSGAVSYCAYQLIMRYRAAKQMLEKINLVNPQPLASILDTFAESLVKFLKLSGLEVNAIILSEG
jgi:geranylgeranyl diphosphate synthase, type I